MLDGLRVVEMGSYVVIPKAARMLADWGAEVIKVDSPRGDYWRHYARDLDLPCNDEGNVLFQSENVNKRCIALDLKQSEGLEVLFKLLETADVFMCNLRTDSLKRLGLDYESLKERFPGLIYAGFSGYGEDGPEQDKPGYDATAYWTRSGALLAWTLKGNVPFKPLPGFGDSTVAPMVVSGILAAVYRREKTGRGESVHSSLLAAGLFYNSTDIVCAQHRPREAYPMERTTMPGPAFTVYRTADDNWIHFSTADWEKRYHLLLEALHMERFIGDPRFITFEATVCHCAELVPLFDEAIAKLTATEVLSALEARNIICAQLTHPSDTIRDEQAWANGYLEELQLDANTEVVIPHTPVRFGSTPLPELHVAPMPGEHSEEILRELGYEECRIQALLARGAAITRETKAEGQACPPL